MTRHITTLKLILTYLMLYKNIGNVKGFEISKLFLIQYTVATTSSLYILIGLMMPSNLSRNT